MISVHSMVGLLEWWAAASNTTALANARVAAIDCSRIRLERAEVEDYLARLDVTGQARAASSR